MSEETSDRYAQVVIESGYCLTCMDCGSIVLDRKIHDTWHRDLSVTVAAIVTEALIAASHDLEARRA